MPQESRQTRPFFGRYEMARAALRDDKVAFAADPTTTGNIKVSTPMN